MSRVDQIALESAADAHSMREVVPGLWKSDEPDLAPMTTTELIRLGREFLADNPDILEEELD